MNQTHIVTGSYQGPDRRKTTTRRADTRREGMGFETGKEERRRGSDRRRKIAW
jgi:hypothetical protein